ncbi:MAG TPA: Fic family protein [Thermoanaerobaculia bacterium]|jgi:Fic family protein
MKASDFSRDSWGRLARIAGGYEAFVPKRLPPPLPSTWALSSGVSRADRALAELAGAGRSLPNPRLLVAPFVHKEAVLSSRIEGTQASLSDLFFFESGPAFARAGGGAAAPDDVREVANYVTALEYGLARLGTLPISLRLLRELHERLMDGIGGAGMTPGEFRTRQNWIGPPESRLDDAVFVPPPVREMERCLHELEAFVHASSDLPALVRIALVHYQFEAIHPFIDGNGRIGRLLISLLLSNEGLLVQPLLSLSAFFERRRKDYYRLLLDVSRSGEWTAWVEFFLAGVEEQARDAIRRTGTLLDLRQEYRARFESARSSALLLKLVDGLLEAPVLTIPQAARRLKVTHRAATLNVLKLVEAGVVAEVTGRGRNRIFVARGVLGAIEK